MFSYAYGQLLQVSLCRCGKQNGIAARRKAVLPLVSKQWARALCGPSHAWRAVSIGRTEWIDDDDDDDGDEDEEDADKPLNAAAVLAWFNARPTCAF